MILYTLATYFLKNADNDNHIVAFRHGQPVLYKQFLHDVACVAQKYKDVVSAAVVCDDSYNFCVGLFGLLQAGARVVLPPGMQDAVIEQMASFFDVVVTDKEIIDECNCVPNFTLHALDITLPVIDFYTSGSTGKPKKITKCLAMFERELAVIEKEIGNGLDGRIVFSTVPHYHVYGITFKIFWSLICGRPFDVRTCSLWEQIDFKNLSKAFIISSPAHLGRLTGLPFVDDAYPPDLILSAGAPLSKDASDEVCFVFKIRPVEVFGSTELGAIATRAQDSCHASWRVLPSVSVRCDESGLLSVRSSFIGGDWVETADVVALTVDGFCHKGRSDKIVKIEGKRISITNAENALIAHPYIAEMAVVVLGDPLRLAGVVKLNDDGLHVLSDVGAFRLGRIFRNDLLLRLDPAGIPRQWRFVDEVPRNSMGKICADDLVSLFGDEI